MVDRFPNLLERLAAVWLNLFLRCHYTSPGMILRSARQGIQLFSVDMHPPVGKKRVAGTHFSIDMNALTGI
jgi:hypothetical protein